MAKNKPPRPHVKARPADLKNSGLNAFQRGNLDNAIEIWERLPLDAQLSPALAEAHFRRGLKRLYGKQPDHSLGKEDLEKAALLQPTDPRFPYQLGLLAQRAGRLPQALEYYRQAYPLTAGSASGSSGGWRKLRQRMAYVLALALLQTGADPANDRLWPDLRPEDQARLLPVLGLRSHPYQAPPDAPALIQGLAAFDRGQVDAARRLFAEAGGAPDRRTAALAHLYLGQLVGQAGDIETARQEWIEAYRGGLSYPRLQANLGEYYQRAAEDRLAEGELDLAQAAAAEAARHIAYDKALFELRSQVEQQLGYRQANAGQWEAARSHWEAADKHDPGGFRLAYNLALAYEKEERWLKAAEAWRDALRRRPRRADHPDAISESQVAQLWLRAANGYRIAKDFSEAAHVLQQAIKYSEELDIRLALVQTLVAGERLQAAENEVDRILERDPDSIPALLIKGELVDRGGYWYFDVQPATYWERVLELDPQNRTARQLLVDYFLNKGDDVRTWTGPQAALVHYLKAQSYLAGDPEILAKIVVSYVYLKDEPKAAENLAVLQSLAEVDLEHLDHVIVAYLNVGSEEPAWGLVDWAEGHLAEVPPNYYLFRAISSFSSNHPDQAIRFLERAVARAAPGIPILAVIGQLGVMINELEIARGYLERAIAAGQAVAQAYLTLGLVVALAGDRALARQHWQSAEQRARQDKNSDLKKMITMLRSAFAGNQNPARFFGGSFPLSFGPSPYALFMSLLPEYVPELVGNYLFGGDDDEDDLDYDLFGEDEDDL